MESVSRLLASRFDQCSDHCGWIAAFIAALSYGTFGVPIKETKSVDVHPMVLQSYKTFTMFLFSWFIVLTGEPLRFTPWGLLSGLLFVTGGAGGIYGIRNAGMAVAAGTWSSCMVIINFLVGILFFQEPVASVASTFAAFVCLGCGLVGMSIFSAPPAIQSSLEAHDDPLMKKEDRDEIDQEQEMSPIAHGLSDPSVVVVVNADDTSNNQVTSRRTGDGSENMTINTLSYGTLKDPPDGYETEDSGSKKDRAFNFPDSTVGFGMGMTKRQKGILGSVFNGVLTGCSFIPIHYAKIQGFGGASYMLSFANGALLAQAMIWVIWYTVKLIATQRDVQGNNDNSMNFTLAYESMPHWYFKQLWIPAFSAGILLSMAMFGSIISITYLGQGVGNSIVQSKILISGLWGIFWYREIVGGEMIAKWFASAAVTVFAILWLSYERIHAGADGAHL